jgi:hypothetical protein
MSHSCYLKSFLLVLALIISLIYANAQWGLLPWGMEEFESYGTCNKVDFVNDSTGFLLTDYPIPPWPTEERIYFVLKTNDYGISWEPIFQELFNGSGLGNGIVIHDIDFVSESIGYLSVTYYPNWESAILKTTDGGDTWNQISELNLQTVYRQIEFESELIGYGVATGDGWSVYVAARTLDGGLTWQEDFLAGGRDLFLSGTCEVWTIYHYSLDCGGNWNTLSVNTGGVERTWLCVAKKGNILLRGGMGLVQDGTTFNTGAIGYSSDAGLNMQVFDFLATSNVSEVHLVNENEGYALAAGPWPYSILRTWDGGLSWHFQNYPTENQWGFNPGSSSISCPSPDVCYIAGGFNLLRTFNGGGPSIGLADYTVSTIEAVKPALSAEIFPNPASAQFTLSFTQSLPGAATLTATDITGRQIARHQIPPATSSTDISVHGWPSGLYVLRIETGGEVWWEKIVVE